MKSIFPFSILAILLLTLSTTGCEKDRCTQTQEYTEYQPVYKRIDEMRMPVSYSSSRTLKSPGKIFYYHGFLLVNEMHEGIHVIDNRDPASPLQVGFIEIPGNLDMAVHDDVLYADSYLDLVAVDIKNPQQPAELSRVNDVFQSFYSFNEQLGYLVEYVPTDVTRTLDCSNNNWGNPIFWEGTVLLSSESFQDFSGRNISSSSAITPSVVAGGSMARFTAADDYLYTIDGQEIKVFDVSNANPVLKNEVVVQWGIETLFPMAGTLFIGSNNGMIIYDISNPESPQYRSTFSHATACDPVVVDGDNAYVTLRDGNECFGFINQLDVVDVSNLDNPTLIRSYSMDNPHGLSVVNETLYLCEGSFGLKTFDVSDTRKISQNLLDNKTGFFAYDVIVLPPGDHVMVVGRDGLYQFDATDRADLVQISKITIEE